MAYEESNGNVTDEMTSHDPKG